MKFSAIITSGPSRSFPARQERNRINDAGYLGRQKTFLNNNTRWEFSYGSYYQDAAVAANDIGAINYLADIRCLDLWGIGNADIDLKKRNGFYNREQIESVTRSKNIRIAILYDSWFSRHGVSILPSQWIHVGEWKISKNFVCGDEIVTFYAVNLTEAANLQVNLNAFSSSLPKTVCQIGEYTR